ncbi:uncharacterized protein LOC135951946 [Calliphora vicina]|uniref:uncharacterized protein LOC135951946 n=1 Tax=Calliphora vicina TaxID=7373 RepID=UPI00325C0D14
MNTEINKNKKQQNSEHGDIDLRWGNNMGGVGNLRLDDWDRIYSRRSRTQLNDMDGLLGLSGNSIRETSATQRQEDMVQVYQPAQSRLVERRSPPAAEAGCDTTTTQADPSKVVRQEVVEEMQGANPQLPIQESRTKEEKAKSGTRKSLAFMNKMVNRDPKTFTAKERYLVRKHRQDIAKFERIYGPVSAVLGISSTGVKLVNEDAALKVTQQCTGAATTVTSSTKPALEGSGKSVEVLTSSERAPKTDPPLQRTHEKAPESSGVWKKADDSSFSSGMGPQKKATKRARTWDDQPSTSKKIKKSTSQECLQALVIDRNNPHLRISSDHWQLVEGRLLDEIAVFSGRPDDVLFMGAAWTKGIKTVNCANENSFEFLKSTVSKCDNLCPGAKLEVIYASDLPPRSMVTVWFPPPIKTVETILLILAKQNTGLLTNQWKLLTSIACRENSGRDFKFDVDHESLLILEEKGGIVNFGLGTVKFRLPKVNKTNNDAGGVNRPAPQ